MAACTVNTSCDATATAPVSGARAGNAIQLDVGAGGKGSSEQYPSLQTLVSPIAIAINCNHTLVCDAEIFRKIVGPSHNGDLRNDSHATHVLKWNAVFGSLLQNTTAHRKPWPETGARQQHGLSRAQTNPLMISPSAGQGHFLVPSPIQFVRMVSCCQKRSGGDHWTATGSPELWWASLRSCEAGWSRVELAFSSSGQSQVLWPTSRVRIAAGTNPASPLRQKLGKPQSV
mmetsp:Transcript_70614/g.188211  ORF Transcript_70614/g.188211 Transcript_70614/m.188211 type:complete len:230 (+) Transcript_70614:711-1400(+)